MITDLSQFTDAEIDALAQLDIADIINGKIPVTADTPVLVFNAATEQEAVVTVGELGEDLLRTAHSPGYLGTPAGWVLGEQGVGLLTAAGIKPQSGRRAKAGAVNG